MAPVWLKPVEIQDDGHDLSKLYAAPIYKTSERKGVSYDLRHVFWFQMY